MRKPRLIFIVCLLTFLNASGQLMLPTTDILKVNKVQHIVVVKHTLIDTVPVETAPLVDLTPQVWAKYWINKKGTPDSMYNYMQGAAYRKELYQYDKKGRLRSIAIYNYKNELTVLEELLPSKRGMTYRMFSKGALKTVKKMDKDHRVYLSKQYADAKIYGYDSSVMFHDFDADTSQEAYYLNGKVSHQLTKKWLGAGPDSFYQCFYQSTAESGRMPSYELTFSVADNGSINVPDNLPFGEMFKSIQYSDRFEMFMALDHEFKKTFQLDALIEQSDTFKHRSKNQLLSHYYTFEYAFR